MINANCLTIGDIYADLLPVPALGNPIVTESAKNTLTIVNTGTK